MIAESQIREKLGRYLRKELSLDAFEDWLAERSWNMHKDSDEPAQKLASRIELRLAEHSSGHLDEDSLREELRPFATSYNMHISFGEVGEVPATSLEAPNNVVATANSRVVAFPVPAQTQEAVEYVDTTRAVARG